MAAGTSAERVIEDTLTSKVRTAATSRSFLAIVRSSF
jgi:hypothetical protein